MAPVVGDGFWHTDGALIKDAAGNVVRFCGVNWHGMDSENLIPHGLWGQSNPANVHTIERHLDEMNANGFNLIRLAFSSEIFLPGQKPKPSAIDPGSNGDLLQLTCLEVLDRIVTSAGARGIRIILDYHRLVAGGDSEGGLWYDTAAGRTEEQWMANWETLARRYRNDPTVVGADLFNEVHGPVTWDADGRDPQHNWRWAVKRCASRILAIHPEWLICVQGMPAYGGVGGWWGEVHTGVKDHPLDLAVPNRLVYQVHDYGPVVWDQPFHDPSKGFPGNLRSFWDQVFGFLVDQGVGPVWVGEWGSFLNMAEIEALGQGYTDRGNRELQGWFPAMKDYIGSKGLSWTWWTWTPESRDTGGILAADYTVNRAKAAQLDAVKYPAFAPSKPGQPPSPPVPPTPPAPSTKPVGDGFWHTDGALIKDAAGNVVRFCGVNWHGMDSENLIPHGLWGQSNPANVHTIERHLDEMNANGFNLIRLAFSSEIFLPGQKPKPSAIDPGSNGDLLQLTCLEVLDRIVTSAGARGIRIILDYHRLVAGGDSEGGLWYDTAAGRTEEQWMANWETLARRYRNDPTVVGADLFNEVHGPVTWDADGRDPQHNWRWAVKRCASRILAIHPEWLICVQGMPAYGGVGGWWGEVHTGVKDHPLDLAVPNRLVYQVHDYGPVVWDQPFHDPSKGFPGNLRSFWDQVFGFLVDQGVGPVWVGEWGSFLNMAEIEALGQGYTDRGNRELQGWFPAMKDYIGSKGLSWTWWTWTPESRDTGGILAPDYTVNKAKAAQLDAVKYPAFAPSKPGQPPSTPVPPTPSPTLTKPAAKAGQPKPS